MPPKLVLFAFLMLTFLTPNAQALDDANLPLGSLRFFGRWDLRAPDRAITVNSGSYVLTQFSGSTISAKFNLSTNQDPLPVITWRIDNGTWQFAEIAPEVKLADNLPAGPHTLWLMVRGMDEHQPRWKAPLVASVTFLGFDLPSDGKLLLPLPEWDHPKLKMEFLGDSITEGVLVGGPHGSFKGTWAWSSNALGSWAAQTAMNLGAMWRQVGFGATGLKHGGSGGAIGALDSFGFFYDGCPRDDWQPDVVIVNQGANDKGDDPVKYSQAYEQYLVNIRAAYPKAKIVAVRPYSGAQADAIKVAVDTLRAAGDKENYYIDTTGWYLGPLHPPLKDCTDIATKLAAALQAQVLTAPEAAVAPATTTGTDSK